MNSEIHAVVVTYNPDIASLSEVVMALLEQVDRIIIVDNDSENVLEIEDIIRSIQAELIKLSENRGIAAAQNIGIRYADSRQAKYILLMDQDTVLPEGAVAALHKECIALESRGLTVGAVGCAYRDTHDGKLNAIWKANGLSLEKQRVNFEGSNIIEVDFVIASGSLIPISTLKQVGLMEEGLFIDLVDIEWGLRAKFHGYQSYQSSTNIMTHTLGTGRQKILWKSVTLHSPTRNYYSIRNSILLARRHYIGWAWRLYFIRRIFLYFVVFGIFPNQKWPRVRVMVRGFFDGIFSREGPISSN
jgi:rhamnosyltransferase